MRNLAMILIFLFMFGTVMAQDGSFAITGADVATQIDDIPWDAAPNPDGTIFYFTTSSGVFSVPAGGGEVETLSQTMVSPFGIAVSTDGETIYVADPWAAGPAGNAIYAIPAAGGDPVAVGGTSGTSPRGLDVVNENGADFIYYTGVDPSNGQPAVLKVLAEGGWNSVAIVSGAPLVDPSGIAVTNHSAIYVLDRLASGGGLGSVFHIDGPVFEPVATGIRTGAQLAGIALSQAEDRLLVSQLDADAGTAQVLLINLINMDTSIVEAVINVNTSAGGLHRAYNADIFAWLDSGGDDGRGQVYRITTRGQS